MKQHTLLLFFLLSSCVLQAQGLTAEQNTKLSECELQIGNLESAIEMAESDYEDAIRELKAGLFCSDCKRPKSEIERETKKSFESHIAEGGPSRKIEQAPQSAYDQARSKYQSKIDGYKSRLASQRQQCERMQQSFKDQAKRKQEQEDREKQNALDKEKDAAATKQQKAKEDALARQREQDARDAENARRRAAYIAEQERLRQENIQALRSNISGSMSSFNADARENTDRKVKDLAREKDWIENNNKGTNQQLQQQQSAKRKAQEQWDELNSQAGDMYKTVQTKTSGMNQQLKQTGRSVAQNSNEKYEQAKSWLSDFRVKANETCNGNCFFVPVKVVKYTAKEVKGIMQDYLKLVTWPVNAPFELQKVNNQMIDGITNSLDDAEKMESVIDRFKTDFARMLPFGSTAERLKKYGFAN